MCAGTDVPGGIPCLQDCSSDLLFTNIFLHGMSNGKNAMLFWLSYDEGVQPHRRTCICYTERRKSKRERHCRCVCWGRVGVELDPNKTTIKRAWASSNNMYISSTLCKKVSDFSLPRLVCHLPNSPWPEIIKLSRPERVW